jgi:hypothetical protein
MSEIDIEIRNTIQNMIDSGREVSIATIQEELKHNAFFLAKGIELVPAEWIVPALEEEIRTL